jgi:predicted metal-binding protein
LYPPFVTEKDIDEIGNIIRKDETWVLQQFRNTADCNVDIEGYNKKTVDKLLELAKTYTPKAYLRYV